MKTALLDRIVDVIFIEKEELGDSPESGESYPWEGVCPPSP